MKSPTSEIVVADKGLTFKTKRGEIIAKLYVEESEYGYSGDRYFDIYNKDGYVIDRLYTSGGDFGGFQVFYPKLANTANTYGAFDLRSYIGGGLLHMRSEKGNVSLTAGKDAGILEISNGTGAVIAIIRPDKEGNLYLQHSKE